MDGLNWMCFPYNEAPKDWDERLRRLIGTVWEGDARAPVHLAELEAQSFCAFIGEDAVGYAGVIRWNVAAGGERYRMCGLSCVCTSPRRRGLGIGAEAVRRATAWIASESGADVGLFTCAPALTPFYERAGVWKRDASLILKGSGRDGAHSSDRLGVDVLKALLSERARRHAERFTDTTLVLDLPEGQFI